MDEITLDDKTYVSSKRAAKITGYAKDYVGQLCREGRVEARLVGRNWYVLESSIREHRFGAPEDVVAKPEIAHSETIADAASAFVAATSPQIAPMSSDVVSTGSNTEAASTENAWKPSNYSPVEAPMLIPILKTEEKQQEINVLEKYTEKNENYGVFNEAPAHSTAIKEMQSAWHDWFVRTNELDVSKETLLENPEKSFKEATVGTRLEEEATPITLEKVSEAIKERSEEKEQSFGEEESVVLHRAPSNSAVSRPIEAVTPVQSVPTIRTVSHSSVYSRSELRRDVFTNQHQQEGTIIRERRVKRRKRPSLFVQVILFVIIIAAILVTLIGSGKFDAYLSQQRFNYRALQYLGGESTVLNSNK